MLGVRSRTSQCIGRGRSTILACLCLLSPGLHAESEPQAPQLEAVQVGVTDGHAQLRWGPASPVPAELELEYELEECEDGSFGEPLLRYRGKTDTGFVSGLPEGDHYYRVRVRKAEGAWSEWSSTLVVAIRPHDLTLAWSLFGVGAFLVLCIVAFLLVADRRVRGEEEERLA